MMKKRFILLVNNYLSGTATNNEKQLVDTYLDRLENAGTVPPVGEEEEKQLQQEIWQKIQSTTAESPEIPVIKRPWYRSKIMKLGAVAACIAGVAGLAIFFWGNNQTIHQNTVKNSGPDAVQPVVHQLVNTTGEDERYRLPDSSWIILARGSNATYQEPFSQRNISLSGKAWFKVKKDASRPLTVASSAITTTVLGTEFQVNAYEKSSQLTVRLYEGKVMIKPAEPGNWRMKKDFYLSPGEEFIYRSQALAEVHSFIRKTNATAHQQPEQLYTDDPFISQNAKGTWYMFNNQSLGQVFDQLSFTYNTPILYNKKDVQNKYFVGRFRETDSLDIILKYITIANRLKVAKTDNGYYISK